MGDSIVDHEMERVAKSTISGKLCILQPLDSIPIENILRIVQKDQLTFIEKSWIHYRIDLFTIEKLDPTINEFRKEF